MIGTILLVILLLVLVGVLPSWNYSRNWGWTPTGVAGALLVALLILIIGGKM